MHQGRRPGAAALAAGQRLDGPVPCHRGVGAPAQAPPGHPRRRSGRPARGRPLLVPGPAAGSPYRPSGGHGVLRLRSAPARGRGPPRASPGAAQGAAGAAAGPLRRRGTGALRYSEHTTGKVEAALTRACRKGLEGLIVKRRDLPYESGRTKSWLKVKCQNRQELVVIGFTEPKGRRSGIGALILGFRDDDGVLRYAGRVGTGMDDAMLASLRKQLEPLRRATSPAERGVPRSQTGITWVEPKLVAEVSFTEWTSDGILRHPSFEGLREDKSPREVRREEPMQVSGIALSNADRVLYPEQGLTKLDLAAYYEAISPWMLPHVAGRPLSLVRCPGGRAKACFYQKHWSGHLPEALETVDIKEASGSTGSYSVVRDAAGLVSLVQYGVLEVHTWGARADQVESPDRIIFDLDPALGVPWAKVRAGAEDRKSVVEGKSVDLGG